jgi:hypothetical protein
VRSSGLFPVPRAPGWKCRREHQDGSADEVDEDDEGYEDVGDNEDDEDDEEREHPKGSAYGISLSEEEIRRRYRGIKS